MIKAKKSLGQNFLVDKKIINTIIDVVKIKNESILEIGPGMGVLTKFLLKKKYNLRLVEIDTESVSFLINNLGIEESKIIENDSEIIDQSKHNAPYLANYSG